MSYYGGGNRRKQRRGQDEWDYHERRREVYEAPEEKLKTMIIKLGEVDPIQEIPRLAEQIQEQATIGIPVISEGLRIGVTEEPFKIPHYAALLALLHESPAGAPEDASGTPLGRQVLEDFWKGFQTYLDQLAWRETRLCVHFFAHLTVAKIVSSQTMYELLKSFTAVLDEFGVSHGRAKQAALCAAEGLMMAGPVIRENPGANVTEIIGSIQAYIEGTIDVKGLVQPTVKFFKSTEPLENADEILDSALAVLQILNASDFAQTPESYPQPYLDFSPFTGAPFDLPTVLVPPEVIELDGLSTDSGEDALVKKEEWPNYYIRLFDNDVTPDLTTPVGYALRTAILDLVDIYEVNRKECARLLLEFPKWTLPGTFKPRPGAPSQEPVAGKDWQLESTIIEAILGALLLLPESRHKPVYYISLITELCKLSPSTVGPAVGKSIRKLYGLLADGLDVVLAYKFADWFSIHMSNFNFQWVWKEWVPDLSLSPRHPKRLFMKHVVEYEIRLSYYDRVLKTLPEPMQSKDALMMPTEAPGPNYEWDEPSRPHYDAAQTILGLLRGRAKAEDVIAQLDTFKSSLEISETNGSFDSTIRSLAVQGLLHIGSRSFSHFLNAIERYLPMLRSLASPGGTADIAGRMDILDAVAAFWKHNKYMIIIVFDKLMQYQIVDPADVISWTFTNGTGSSSLDHPTINSLQWDLIKGALDKANGRVVICRRKVSALRKEEDDNAARAKASNGTTMEVDTEAKPDAPEPQSQALTSALKVFNILTRDQKTALSGTLEGFVNCLASVSNPNPTASSVVTENAWHNRANWTEADWATWETWSWYRHFCRMYSPYLRNYANTLGTVSFAKVGPSSPAVDMFRGTWNIATGQDS